MSRVNAVIEWHSKNRNTRASLTNALIRSLPLDEQLMILRRSYINNLDLRNSTLGVLEESLETGWHSHFSEFVKQILSEFSELPGRRRTSFYFCLSRIFGFAPSSEKHEILRFLFATHLPAANRQALRLIDRDTMVVFHDDILRVALEDGEPLAVSLLIEYSSSEVVFFNLRGLVDVAGSDWVTRRLFLKAAEFDPNCLADFPSDDLITQTYLLAKSGGSLKVEVAKRRLQDHLDSDRVDILIWSLGKMGFWDELFQLATSGRLDIQETETA